MSIDIARGARGTRPPLNFHNIIQIWPPRLREIIQMIIILSVIAIETYIWTVATQ